jgi:hypothetical protein
LAESGFRPEPTPRAYRGERVTGQAPCYPILHTMPSVCIHSPVRSVQAPRSGRARVGIQPGRIVPAQRCWPPVRLFGPGYTAPALRTVSPVPQQSPVRPVPAPHTNRAKGGIQQGRETSSALCTMPPVHRHSPVRPVLALHTHRAKVGIKPGRVVAAPRTRLLVRLLSLVRPVPAPRTKPPVMIHQIKCICHIHMVSRC